MRQLFGHRLRETISRFRRDTSGVTLIYITVALPVLIGFGLLAIDVGRLFSLQSSLQHGADALALAGAGELDRRADALTRADRAVDNLLLTNPAIFSTSVAIVDHNAVTRRYLDAIPASDATAIDATYETTDPAQARFLQIVVAPANFTTIFPATFLGLGSNSTSATAQAVAGMDQAVCNFTPMFMCNPFEPATGTTDALTDYGFYSATSTVANRRRQMALKAHDQNSQWTPGNFGFLQPEAGPGAKTLGVSIASISPQACFLLEGLNTQTGNMTSLKEAFNTRFDMYNGAFGQASDKTSYPPAASVRKGYIIKKKNGNGQPDACSNSYPIEDFFGETSPATYNDAMGFPRDSCFANNSCTLSGGRMGNGNWGGDTANSVAVPDFEQYWATNFPGRSRPNDSNGQQYSNTNLPSRYEIYRYEIANNYKGDASRGYTPTPPGNKTYSETGTPACNAGAGIDTPDRRILYAAVINCRAVGMSGGSGGPYQALAFGKFFMTEPMGNPPDSTLYTELVDVVQPGQSNSVARDMVQLYR